MADCVRGLGCTAESIDYQGIADPTERVGKLVAEASAIDDTLVLVGSSMGGHVATAASALLRARGLFLLAPAFYMPGHERETPEPADCPLTIVHGWRDEVVPVENSIRYAREHDATLHLIDADHRMQDRIALINYLFEYFLVALDLPHLQKK